MALGVFLFAGVAPRAPAQDVQRIAAIVNDQVISQFDLAARTKLVVASSGLPDTPEGRRRIAPQILRILIDERLQLQEASRRNIRVSEADLSRAIATIEKNNRMPKGGFMQFLDQKGIPHQAAIEQLRATIAWQKLVDRRLRPTVTVGDEEVSEILKRILQSRGQDEARLSEILLAVDSPTEEATVRQNAQRLVDQLRRGARFDAVARQFSQGAAAAVGGDLGWIREGELDPALGKAVAALAPGEISDPVRSGAGYHILRLTDRRKFLAGDPGKTKVTLNQVFLPLPPGASEAAVETQVSLANTLRETVRDCKDMEAAAKEARSPRPAELGTFTLKDLSASMRRAVASLKVGQTSAPQRLGDGVMVLMVCERVDPPSNLPTRASIRRSLFSRRLETLARRYLRDLRLASIVDLRV